MRRDIGGDKQHPVVGIAVPIRAAVPVHPPPPIRLLTVVYDSKPFRVYIKWQPVGAGSRPPAGQIIAAIVAAIIAITAIVILVQSVVAQWELLPDPICRSAGDRRPWPWQLR